MCNMESVVVWHDLAVDPDDLPPAPGFLARFCDGSVRIVNDLGMDGVVAWTLDYDPPSSPCDTCFLAEWYDLYGRMVYCCDMAGCIRD